MLATIAASALVLVTETRAATITGDLWDTGITDATPGAPPVPAGAPDVTFSVPNGTLDFDSRNAGDGYTIGGWLATGGATLLTGDGTHTLDDTYVHLSGFVTLASDNQSFTVAHDDGLTLIINGQTVIDASGPTAPAITTGTYTGAAGTYAFDLYYAEVDGPPGVLNVNLPFAATPTTPDGGTTVGLLGLGLAGLAALGRRVRAS